MSVAEVTSSAIKTIGLGAVNAYLVRAEGGFALIDTGKPEPRAAAQPGRPQSPAMDIRGTLTFDPVPEGTRMGWHWELAPRGFLRLLTPLVARMGRRQEEAIWAGLKRVLEGHEKSPSQVDEAGGQTR